MKVLQETFVHHQNDFQLTCTEVTQYDASFVNSNNFYPRWYDEVAL
jgi:hypothetical protein